MAQSSHSQVRWRSSFWGPLYFAPKRGAVASDRHRSFQVGGNPKIGRGTPKWMVKIMEHPIKNRWFWGKTHYFWKHPYFLRKHYNYLNHAGWFGGSSPDFWIIAWWFFECNSHHKFLVANVHTFPSASNSCTTEHVVHNIGQAHHACWQFSWNLGKLPDMMGVS